MLATKIETERLVLRPLDNNDAHNLFTIFSDHTVMRYWNTEPWSTLQDAERFISSSADSMQKNEELTLGVFLKESQGLLGKIMLFQYHKESKRAEIGFGISLRHGEKGSCLKPRAPLLIMPSEH